MLRIDQLSIGLDEVEEREHLRKQRLRGSDNLGYLLDVLLYNLRDDSSIALDVAMEERDAMGRSEEEQVDEDDEEEVKSPATRDVSEDNQPDSNTLTICHNKVGSLVTLACEKLDSLKNSNLELDHCVVIMAGILSALRLLRGLDGKVSWVGAGQTAVPPKDIRKLFLKIAEVDEMNDFTVELFVRKRELIIRLQKNSLIKSIAGISDNSVTFNFLVTSDLGDELISSSNKELIVEICSLYNVTDPRVDFIETIKLQTQNNKNKISVIPDNSGYTEINSLIEDIQRFSYIDGKHGTDNDPTVRQIIRQFSVIRDEKEKDLLSLINKAYTKSTAVYLLNAVLLNEINFKAEINSLQKKVLDNVFTKRPSKQLSEAIGLSILKEKQNDKLPRFNDGSDFAFFDTKGNFVGDNLQCIDSITSRIKSQYLSGKDLELELKGAPTGYEYGTVATLLAVLFRAGRLTAKFNGDSLFSYRDEAVNTIFSSSKNFQKASFKSISKSLTTAQKNDIVQVLRDLKIDEITNEKVDWNTNDFQLIEAVRARALSTGCSQGNICCGLSIAGHPGNRCPDTF